ncbi:MAG: PD-(D/E)XK nuclease family protein [Thermoleophilia bacterium]
MKALSSSALRNFTRHCPHALTLYEERRPYPRDIFGPGIVAHAVLQAYPCDTESLVIRLSTEGRSYHSEMEPPIPIEAALQGAKMATDYADKHGIPEGRREVWLKADANWQACEYPEASYHGILDLTWTEQTEGDEYAAESTGIVVRDWKSAWTANQEECSSLQMRGYALLAIAEYEEKNGQKPDWIRREITSIRTGHTFAEHLDLDEAGLSVLEEWKADLSTAIKAASIKPRQANPGPRCMGCPYVLQCEAACLWITHGWAGVQPEALAAHYAILKAQTAALEPAIRAACDNGAIRVPGGSVGYHVKTKKSPKVDAGSLLARRWHRVSEEEAVRWEGDNASWLGFLGALKIGSGNVGAVATALTPGKGRGKKATWKEDREDLLDACLDTVHTREFGIEVESAEIDSDLDPSAQTNQENS